MLAHAQLGCGADAGALKRVGRVVERAKNDDIRLRIVATVGVAHLMRLPHGLKNTCDRLATS